MPGSHVLPTYARADVTFVRGEGAWLAGDDGTRYLDLVAGIAVVGLGHLHPAPLAAAHEQLEKLWHVSNLYWTEPMQALASRLSDRFGGAGRSSATRARRRTRRRSSTRARRPASSGFVALEGSFHGRTFGALAVTGQPAKRAAFEPLLPGVAFASRTTSPRSPRPSARTPPRSCSSRCSARAASTRSRPSSSQRRATLADEHGALLVFDEVQTGVGRTGTFFAWEQAGVKPDAVTLAKGLANGLPIGALLVADDAPARLRPRRPRRHVRRQPRRLRRGVRRRATSSRTSCSRACARSGAQLAAG